mmetsp:Transcript_5911/g.12359  ORF Transcript_5911/g.12359 Transcript_5911/m.12359 type:complete len:87 (+) Transcript_5911:1867-2127(+)
MYSDFMNLLMTFNKLPEAILHLKSQIINNTRVLRAKKLWDSMSRIIILYKLKFASFRILAWISSPTKNVVHLKQLFLSLKFPSMIC